MRRRVGFYPLFSCRRKKRIGAKRTQRMRKKLTFFRVCGIVYRKTEGRCALFDGDFRMDGQKNKKGRAVARRLVFTALFAALCCVGTCVLAVPMPYGYFNLGDVFVLLAGWCLGPAFGAAAASLGSGAADLIGGYAIYAPATFVIKGCMAAAAYAVAALFKGKRAKIRADFPARAASAVCAEIVMAAGYFAYDTVLYGIAGGAVSIVGNALQACFGAVCAVLLAEVLRTIRPVGELFPKLNFGAPKNGQNVGQKQ